VTRDGGVVKAPGAGAVGGGGGGGGEGATVGGLARGGGGLASKARICSCLPSRVSCRRPRRVSPPVV